MEVKKIREIIRQMTLEEKAGLCSGFDFWHTKAVERLGIPSVMVADGPHGLRKQDGEADHLGINESIQAVCFPAACATASSFDTELIRKLGEILGEECQAEDLSILLGPAVNIKRSPLCGRNFEYMSEDPYLTGKMAAAYIQGVQSWDVGTSIKHFAANNQEYKRMSCSSNLSERALREIYLPAFETAVKEAQPKTVMCSYNKVNGTYAAENKYLLTEILRDEWGFEGYVVTDWGAVADRVKGIQAGLELEMPSSNGINDKKIVEAVKDGSLDEKILDRAVERMLKVLFEFLDNRRPEAVFDKEKDHGKATDIETECAVLLENNGILPIQEGKTVAYIGAYAKNPRYQGGGSSHINSCKVTSALDAAKAKGRKVSYVEGFPFDGDELNEAALSEAIMSAKNADVAVIFAGLPDSFESEGFDRKDMKMPECQNRLIEEVAKAQPNTVVVLHNGSPVETPWVDHVAAILEMYLGGQGVGEAADRLLYGEANPCGRLAETFPYKLEDNPSYMNFPGDGFTVDYAEDVYVGYRYYDVKKMPVRWAFGHGLSYTEFEYSNMKLSAEKLDDDSTVEIFVSVKNVGTVSGKEVVQLYVGDRNGTFGRPLKELKGFAKVELAPGETKEVSMVINSRDLSYYNERLGDWYAPGGTYELMVGHASDDIRLSASLSFDTKKRLPFIVNSATTMGELLADPRTALVFNAMMPNMGSGSAFGATTEEAEEVMGGIMTANAVENMMSSMPLKSLGSFGIMDNEQMEGLISVLNKAIAESTE